MSVSALRETLSKLFPADRLRTDGESRHRYQADWSWAAVAAKAAGMPGGLPDLVLHPHDTGEVAAAVRAAAHHGVPLVPWGV